ncbi:MAG: DNA-3-methyladenine glycosylase 2 family protein, partial [Oscillospiraceae bacterium]|nr:DNA-3-methyladenine glycosylase 2 family protein [Oscillospiraceae bacterium]
MAQLTAEDLAPLRCGYRAPYIIDAAQKLASGEITEAAVRSLPLEEARKELLKIKGVGPKVADCVLLFGAGHTDAFPQDVWIKRAMARYFPQGLPECVLPYAGI